MVEGIYLRAGNKVLLYRKICFPTVYLFIYIYKQIHDGNNKSYLLDET